jgi:ABC-type polar amino acid transport system ATPase subunit
MRFQVIPLGERRPRTGEDVVYLVTDAWDDWFKYSTMYRAFYRDVDGDEHVLGEVKIGQFDMELQQRRPEIPGNFPALGDEFFSLGQDDSYYEKLNELGVEVRNTFLTAMRDVALDAERYARALNEEVTGISLLRYVSDETVRGQFRRMATGGARLTGFSFSYTPPPWGRGNRAPVFTFEVMPETTPPSNVHVLIGRNGVGKTHTVNQMTNTLVRADAEEFGVFEWAISEEDDGGVEDFSNIVSVSFSAFDPFEPLPVRENRAIGVRYQYVGLKHMTRNEDGSAKPPKSPDDLAADFGRSVLGIVSHSAKRERWRRALNILERDELFRRSEVGDLCEEYDDLIEELSAGEARTEFRKRARKTYGKMSSGHKIVLLTITRLVELLEERSLVLVDEPEAHLHPPLLSAFIRTLSDLLINRNGVAIIATHSPVILQEVPRHCVWRIRRSGRATRIERPNLETFGENVGTLTHAIFGLEVTESGFHTMISQAIEQGLDYEDIVERFGDQLGDEARGIARSLIATRDREG